jgi:hypothetical protein
VRTRLVSVDLLLGGRETVGSFSAPTRRICFDTSLGDVRLIAFVISVSNL